MNLNRTITGVLFDLDGTLIDTALDLIHALDLSLIEKGFNECNRVLLTAAASHGSLFMVQTTLPNESDEVHRIVQKSMLQHYVNVNGEKGGLFTNIATLLERLDEYSIPYGIVTNKPARFTRPLLNTLQLTSKMKSIISGDSTKVSKPECCPMILAAQQINCKPENILYLGDAQRDINAANNSGMISAAALWGYIGLNDDPKCWKADLLFNDPLDLLSLFKN